MWFTENTEHVCTNCTAGARARLRVRQLTDDELMPNPSHRPSDNSTRVELSNVALAEELGVSDETVRRARLAELVDRGLIALDEIPEAKPHLGQGTGQHTATFRPSPLESLYHRIPPVLYHR